MSRLQKDPLRPLTPDEQVHLEHLSRSQTEPAAHVARAKALLAVAAGQHFTDAARAAGRRSGDAVAASPGGIRPPSRSGSSRNYAASPIERRTVRGPGR